MRLLRSLPPLAATILALSASAETAMEPGNWHLTTRSTTNGKADPVQEQDECLGDELKDLSAYFAPALEGVKAKCTRTPRAARDGSIAYTMKCRGTSFTMDIESAVRVEHPKRFTATLKMDTKTPKERAIVVANIEGMNVGPCKTK